MSRKKNSILYYDYTYARNFETLRYHNKILWFYSCFVLRVNKIQIQCIVTNIVQTSVIVNMVVIFMRVYIIYKDVSQEKIPCNNYF